MKKYLCVLAGAAAISFFSSCKKDDISGIVTQGDWKITSFIDSGNDETHHFNGYTFTFESNGTVKAVNGNTTRSGTWSEGNDDSRHKFYLTFPAGGSFEELNDDWQVDEKTASVIRLRDDNPASAETLVFEKK